MPTATFFTTFQTAFATNCVNRFFGIYVFIVVSVHVYVKFVNLRAILYVNDFVTTGITTQNARVKRFGADCDDCECGKLTFGLLIIQGIATSIDAMSGGVTMAADQYMFTDVALSVAIISTMTFAICIAGIYIGKVFGTKLANKASIFGGSILVIIGIIILVKSFVGA